MQLVPRADPASRTRGRGSARLRPAGDGAAMAPKKGKKKKDDDWEDEADAIALEASLEIKPEGTAAPVDDDEDTSGGKKESKKVRSSRVYSNPRCRACAHVFPRHRASPCAAS